MLPRIKHKVTVQCYKSKTTAKRKQRKFRACVGTHFSIHNYFRLQRLHRSTSFRAKVLSKSIDCTMHFSEGHRRISIILWWVVPDGRAPYVSINITIIYVFTYARYNHRYLLTLIFRNQTLSRISYTWYVLSISAPISFTIKIYLTYFTPTSASRWL